MNRCAEAWASMWPCACLWCCHSCCLLVWDSCLAAATRTPPNRRAVHASCCNSPPDTPARLCLTSHPTYIVSGLILSMCSAALIRALSASVLLTDLTPFTLCCTASYSSKHHRLWLGHWSRSFHQHHQKRKSASCSPILDRPLSFS
jgi:hypothetical protein